MKPFDFLFEHESIYFNLFDRLSEAIYIYNTKKELVYLNRAAENLDGFTLQHGKGKSIFELYDFENEFKEENSPVLNTLKTERSLKNVEVVYYMNGKKIIQICDTAPIYNNGILIGAYNIQRDITDVKNIVEENIALKQKVSRQKRLMEKENDEAAFSSTLIGKSEEFQKCKDMALKAARTDSNIMLIGATGSGKEIFANMIHHHSLRHNGPFLALNCAAIPESLIEGILFGTTKGVYTGAVEKEGLLVQANGGTVFLDEINSMPLASQAKLLRVLEEKSIMKLGSGKEIPIDVRIISSTNELPPIAIEREHLREDLFYRISVVQVTIPSLAQRREDIPLLTEHFISKYNRRFHKRVSGVSPEVYNFFMNFSWPGNVRQLKTCVESAMNFAEPEGMITMEDIPQYVLESIPIMNKDYSAEQTPEAEERTCRRKSPAEEAPPPSEAKLLAQIKQRKKQEFIDALNASDGNITAAAKTMGISKQLMYYYIKKYDLR